MGCVTTRGGGPSRSGGATLRSTLGRVRGRCNTNTIVHLNRGERLGVSTVSANSLALSLTANVNNLPGKEVIRVCKPRSSNGAALTLRYVTRYRGRNNITTFISTRRTLSPMCTNGLKISVSSLLISRPSCNRRTLRVARRLIHSNTISVVIISSITTLIPEARVSNRVNSSRINLRTELVDRTVEGLANTVGGDGYLVVFVGRLHRGINIICNGPRMAANNHTLGFCSSVHVSIHGTRTVGTTNSRIVNAEAGIGVIGGGLTPPFGRTRFSVVCNHNVDGSNRVLSLTTRCSVVGGDNS